MITDRIGLQSILLPSHIACVQALIGAAVQATKPVRFDTVSEAIVREAWEGSGTVRYYLSTTSVYRGDARISR